MRSEPALRLRVLLGDAPRAAHGPLFVALVELLQARGVRGATAWRGSMGFGAGRALHDVASEHTATDLPVVVESVDAPERIRDVLPAVVALVGDGLVTVEPVRVVAR